MWKINEFSKLKKNEILLFEKLLDILGVQVMSKNLIFKFSKLKKF